MNEAITSPFMREVINDPMRFSELKGQGKTLNKGEANFVDSEQEAHEEILKALAFSSCSETALQYDVKYLLIEYVIANTHT
ncbi:hypothetical protein NPIL_221161 [Nephila pilipes]|uniref:Uncharacterized protein n=1 Tax=Nephila pilipes TaxID=299642 RepID=A0A8X6MUG7_NEPPI|nr:hypothetical protein NPIL_221161 [Nephila pilipes]